MQLGVLDRFGKARTPHDVVSATSQFLREDLAAAPVPIEKLATLRVERVEDIDGCIERLQAAMRESPLFGHDEDRCQRLLCYLLVASIRARQLS